MTTTPLTCAEVRDLAPELALDLLDGAVRAAALEHVETCVACRQEVVSLTGAADEILLLVPTVAPPPGFADRVVARLGELTRADAPPATPSLAGARAVRAPRVPRRFLAAAAAVVVAVLIGVGVLAAGPGGDRAVAEATMRTGTGQVVGEVSVVPGDPTTIVLSIPGWTDLVRSYGEPVGATYWLAVERTDGTRALRPLSPSERSAWRVSLADGPSVDAPIAAVSIVDGRGLVWCTATFRSV